LCAFSRSREARDDNRDGEPNEGSDSQYVNWCQGMTAWGGFYGVLIASGVPMGRRCIAREAMYLQRGCLLVFCRLFRWVWMGNPRAA
jgi:hypothetical protein